MSDHRRDTWAAYGFMGSSSQGRPHPLPGVSRPPQALVCRWARSPGPRRLGAMSSSPTAPPAADLRERATLALRRLVGRDDVDFRDGQLEAIEALVAGRSRVLVVQRTGWGKSAVYFVAMALRRAEGSGPT